MAGNTVFGWVIKKRLHQMELFKQYPIEVQEEIRQKLIDEAALTAFGKEHKFEKIHTLQDFRNAIPLRSYEEHFPYIERMINGEGNVLWPGKTKWFAKSSGTTNSRSKFIPISNENLEDGHYKGGKDLLAIFYQLRENADLFSGKTLIVGGSTKMTEEEENTIGDLSGIIISNLPFWVEMKRVPQREISLMDNWEEKLDAMALNTMNEDVRVLSGVPSWTLLLLRRILELKKAKHIHEVWPNLQMYMHGGISFAPYREQFNAILPNGTTDYFETYNASEGFFGIQDQLNSNEMLLMLDYGVYYEFLPLEELNSKKPRALSLEEVELNRVYALVITTNTGLWRYMIGDTIRFTHLYPFRFRIVGRTKQFINLTGEELMVENAESALRRTCTHMNIHVVEYTVAPSFPKENETAAHEWFIEFENNDFDFDRFCFLLDENLRDENSDYDAKRNTNLNLGFPIVHKGKKDVFYTWLKKRNKLGGQHKIPRLATDRLWLEELIELNK